MSAARRASQAAAAASPAPSAAPSTLDDAMTIALAPPPVTHALEGLEPTSHSGPVEAPSHSILDAPVVPDNLDVAPTSILDPAPSAAPGMMEIPAGGMLGLEPTSMGSPEPAPAPAPTPGLSA